MMTELFIKNSLGLNEFSNREFLWHGWSSPSNIALVKYWGKKGKQIPQNPSVSFTLSTCRTNTIMISAQKLSAKPTRSFYFEGKEATAFGKKALKLIDTFAHDFPEVNNYDLQILSENTFPHSSGIASSASSMSSLALCLCEFIKSIRGGDLKDFFQKASHYARLGSGSACRSIYGGIVSWGEIQGFEHSSNLHASPVNLVKPFQRFRDAVLIISSDEKSVSSTLGHSLMDDHPFRETRYENAKNNCVEIINLMNEQDISKWGELVEREALELHGLMMNGAKSFILMKPNTLKAIEKIRKFRQDTGVPVYFTLDAGPNVHLLYPDKFCKEVKVFIEDQLIELCENKLWFDDLVGSGPYSMRDGVKC